MRAERKPVKWPGGKAFAFTIFDDPDGQTLESGRIVYDFLADLGFRTTKAVWPLGPIRTPSDPGGSCADPEYLEWSRELQEVGFEIALHNARNHTSTRNETRQGLDRFRELFGHDPHSMANHYFCDENIYHGQYRVSGTRRLIYNVATRGKNRAFFGHVPGHELFWGDLCRERVRYLRNFVFDEIDTLAACPFMPYHDPQRPFVKAWFAGSDGNRREAFVKQIREANQDRLAASGGACIMYTHFGHWYVDNGKLDPDFARLMKRLAGMNGWFVPVYQLLDHLVARRGLHTITPRERRTLEWRWLRYKLLRGTT
jgi:hypothetical protein